MAFFTSGFQRFDFLMFENARLLSFECLIFGFLTFELFLKNFWIWKSEHVDLLTFWIWVCWLSTFGFCFCPRTKTSRRYFKCTPQHSSKVPIFIMECSRARTANAANNLDLFLRVLCKLPRFDDRWLLRQLAFACALLISSLQYVDYWCLIGFLIATSTRLLFADDWLYLYLVFT